MADQTKTKEEQLAEVGRSCYACLAEMVAALECDYERLEELRDERKDLADALKDVEDDAGEPATPHTTASGVEVTQFHCDLANAATAGGIEAARKALEEWDEENAEELKELEEAAGKCKDTDDARQRIEEDPLSIEVRSDWTTPGEEMTAAEFCILLSTGGPATRIVGELDEHGEPCRAWLEVQDWFTPWTEHHEGVSQDTLLTYARCFCFAS